MKLKKDVLTKGVLFLEDVFSVDSPSSELYLKDLRIEESRAKFSKTIIRVSPSHCNICEDVFDNCHSSDVRCFYCDSGMCKNCSSPEAFEKAKSVMRMIAPLCPICSDTLCASTVSPIDSSENNDDKEKSQTFSQILATPPKSELPSSVSSGSSKSPSPPQDDPDIIEVVTEVEVHDSEVEAGGDEAPFVEVKSRKSKNVKKRNAKKAEVIENSDKVIMSKDGDSSKVCAFYIQFRCKHGRSGRDCSFSHPKICINYMKSGSKGCDKSDKCEFLHPNMCKKSLEGTICKSRRCFQGHIQGTREVVFESQSGSSKSTIKSQQNFRKGLKKGHVPQDEKVTTTPSVEVVSDHSPPPPCYSCSGPTSLPACNCYSDSVSSRTVKPDHHDPEDKPGHTVKICQGQGHRETRPGKPLDSPEESAASSPNAWVPSTSCSSSVPLPGAAPHHPVLHCGSGGPLQGGGYSKWGQQVNKSTEYLQSICIFGFYQHKKSKKHKKKII